LAVQEPIAKTFVVKALAACISVAPVLDRLSSAMIKSDPSLIDWWLASFRCSKTAQDEPSPERQVALEQVRDS
jgi:hypothetical protein